MCEVFANPMEHRAQSPDAPFVGLIFDNKGSYGCVVALFVSHSEPLSFLLAFRPGTATLRLSPNPPKDVLGDSP